MSAFELPVTGETTISCYLHDIPEFVEKELQRQGMTDVNLDKLAHSFGFARVADFFAEAGRGEISQRQLQTALHADEAPAAAADEQPLISKPRGKGSSRMVVSSV